MISHWLPARWPAPHGLVAGTSLRATGDFGRHGQQAGDHPLRSSLAAELGLPPLTWLQQVHGTRVLELPTGEALPQADAAVSTTAGQACVVLTADCLPVLFCAVDGSVIGAAHAGWRGLLAGVLEATVQSLRRHTDAPLLAWLGPAIGPQAFEVGPEVRTAFIQRDTLSVGAFVAGRGDRWLADLAALARQRLHAAGLAPEQVYGGGHCTFGDATRFHSYRRDGAASGRMASVIGWHESGPVQQRR